MAFRSPKERQNRLTKYSSSNSIQVSNRKPRNQTQPSKKLPNRPSLDPPRSPASSRHTQNSSNHHVPSRPTHPPEVSAWEQVPMSPPGHSGGSSRQPLNQFRQDTTNALNPDPALCDLISSKFDAIITSIDGESFSGDERELGNRFCFLLRFPG